MVNTERYLGVKFFPDHDRERYLIFLTLSHMRCMWEGQGEGKGLLTECKFTKTCYIINTEYLNRLSVFSRGNMAKVIPDILQRARELRQPLTLAEEKSCGTPA